MREARPSSLTPSKTASSAPQRLERGVSPTAGMVERVVATAAMSLRKPILANPYGRPLKHPKHGGMGIAGMRADLIDGSLTLHQLRTMSLRDLAHRYRTTKPTAYENRRLILAWGLGGAYRLPSGAHRPQGRGGPGQEPDLSNIS